MTQAAALACAVKDGNKPVVHKPLSEKVEVGGVRFPAKGAGFPVIVDTHSFLKWKFGAEFGVCCLLSVCCPLLQ